MVAAYLAAAPSTYLLRDDPLASSLALTLALIAGRMAVIFLYLRVLREWTGLSVPWREATAALLGSIMVLFYSLVSGAWRLRVEEFWPDALFLLPHLAAGGLVYLAVFLAVSGEARLIVARALGRLRSSR